MYDCRSGYLIFFFFKQKTAYEMRISDWSSDVCSSDLGLTAINTQYLKNTSLALFGRLSWKVSGSFSIQPGLRLNYDKKDGYYQRLVFAGDGSPVTRDLTDPVSVARLAVFNPQEYAPSFSDWNFSYDLTATWKPTSGILLYATYAKTFKSGGINQNGVPNGADGNPLLAAATIKPESVQHYEIGRAHV